MRLAYRQAEREMGMLPEPFTLTAHHKKLFTGYGAFEVALERSHEVDLKLKTLGEMKAALMAGCEWCIDIGAMLSYRHGVSEEEMRARAEGTMEPFSDLERLVIEYAEGMTRTPVEVSDELFARLREHFSEKQLVELTAAIAIENYRARFNWAFGIKPQGFTREGDFCPLPEPNVAA